MRSKVKRAKPSSVGEHFLQHFPQKGNNVSKLCDSANQFQSSFCTIKHKHMQPCPRTRIAAAWNDLDRSAASQCGRGWRIWRNSSGPQTKMQDIMIQRATVNKRIELWSEERWAKSPASQDRQATSDHWLLHSSHKATSQLPVTLPVLTGRCSPVCLSAQN